MFAVCVFKSMLCIIVSPNGVCSSLSRLGRNWALCAPCKSCRGVFPPHSRLTGRTPAPPPPSPHPPFLFVFVLLLLCCCCCCCCCYVCLFVLWLLLLLFCFGCKTPSYLLVFASLFVLFVCMKTFVNFRMFCAGFV